MTAPNETPARLLERVRKLLAKAEDESVTPPEAKALTAKAAELMAKYGIDRALLAATQPATDKPGNRTVDILNPWGRVKAHLLCGLAAAMRCKPVIVNSRVVKEGGFTRVHLFGYESDLERVDMLCTSLLIQMWHGVTAAEVPGRTSSARAWRRSWLLGFADEVVARVRAAEQAAAEQSGEAQRQAGGTSTALVLASREQVVQASCAAVYPKLRDTRLTYSGGGYREGRVAGRRADLGTGRVGGGSRQLAAGR